MEYPVIVDGRVTGRLTVTPSGLVTVFEAQCEDTGKVLRLSVYGENEGYLGVMAPREGKLYLRKSLSRSSMRGFPKHITHAGPAGEAPAQETREEAGNSPPQNRERAPKPVENAGRAASGAEREKRGQNAPDAPPQGQEPGADLLWYRTPDGTLFTTWEGRSFMAVPESVRGLPMEKCLERRPIEGRMYAVFETKNGRII